MTKPTCGTCPLWLSQSAPSTDLMGRPTSSEHAGLCMLNMPNRRDRTYANEWCPHHPAWNSYINQTNFTELRQQLAEIAPLSSRNT